MSDVMDGKYILLILVAAGAILFAGCATVRTTDPPATATQQFITSEAVIRSVEQLSFNSLRGRKIYIEDSFLSEPGRDFAAAEFRARILQAGAYLQQQRADAEMIVEIRSGGIGIDRYESLLGIPSISGPAVGTTGVGTPMPALVTPELAISKNLRQVGYASLAYVAYWADTGEIVSTSGPYVGKTLREDWWFMGFGPRTVGNVPVVDTDMD